MWGVKSKNRHILYLRKLLNGRTVSPELYRCYTVYNYTALFGGIGHVLLIPLFIWLGFYSLALFNVGSVVAFLTGFYLNRQGKHRWMYLLCSAEILLHSVLTVNSLGWDSGFHYYVLLIIPLAYFAPFRHRIKLLLTGFFCLSYIVLSYSDTFHIPAEPVNRMVLKGLNSMNILVTFITLSLVAYLYSRAASHTEERLLKVNSELALLARTDALTKLLNRRSMLERIEGEITRSGRSGSPFTLILCDIDNFKMINDEYGHDCGDYILETIAKLMQDTVRKVDQIARWGGEEFLLLLPDTDAEGGRLVAEKIREIINGTPFQYQEKNICVTMTFGVSGYSGSINISDCIIRADKAMYDGKKNGKNCIMHHEY
jgi:diguanylate cyclase